MILTRSGLSGTWYVVTDYIDRDGSIVAKTKHRLSDQQQGELEEMFNVGRGDSSLDDNH